LDLQIGQESDTGVIRKRNEDHVACFVPQDETRRRTKGSIFLVADGIGGNQAGDVASRNAVEWVMEAYYADGMHGAGDSLVRAIKNANRRLHELAQGDPALSGMGTTLVVAVVQEAPARLTVASVGDSRAYLLRRGNLDQLTTDHSWVGEQVKAGLLTPAQAARHPQRNVITRALGLRSAVEVDVIEAEIHEGDKLLLCTDGLSGQLPEGQMARILRSGTTPQASAELVAEANRRGGRDNVSAVVVQLGTLPAQALPARFRDGVDRLGVKALAAGLAILLLACLVSGGVGVFLLLSQEYVGDPAAAPYVAPIDTEPQSGGTGEGTAQGGFEPADSGVIVVGKVRGWRCEEQDCTFRLEMAGKEYQVHCEGGRFFDPRTSLRGRHVWVFGHQRREGAPVEARLIDLGAWQWALWQEPWSSVYQNHDWSQEVWVYTIVDERPYSPVDMEAYPSLERGMQILVWGRWPGPRTTNIVTFDGEPLYRLDGDRYVPLLASER